MPSVAILAQDLVLCSHQPSACVSMAVNLKRSMSRSTRSGDSASGIVSPPPSRPRLSILEDELKQIMANESVASTPRNTKWDLDASEDFHSEEEVEQLDEHDQALSNQGIPPSVLSTVSKLGKGGARAGIGPHDILKCFVCKSTSGTNRWLVVRRVRNPKGQTIDIPQDDLCWICGTACEVWCLVPVQETKAKTVDPDFRKEFFAVRAGVEKAEQKMRRPMTVLAFTGCGLRMSFWLIFVEQDIFKIRFSYPPAKLQCKTNTLTGPDLQQIEGVLFSQRKFLMEIEHYMVEVYYYNERELEDQLLGPDDVRRDRHPMDRFQLAVKNSTESRTSAYLKGKGIFDAPTYEDVKQRADDMTKDRSATATAVATADATKDGHTATIEVVSGSTLSDDVGFTPQAKVVAPKATPGKVERGGPRRSAQGAGNAGGKLLIAVDGLSNNCTKDNDGEELSHGLTKQVEDLLKIVCGWNIGRELRSVLLTKKQTDELL